MIGINLNSSKNRVTVVLEDPEDLDIIRNIVDSLPGFSYEHFVEVLDSLIPTMGIMEDFESCMVIEAVTGLEHRSESKIDKIRVPRGLVNLRYEVYPDEANFQKIWKPVHDSQFAYL